MAQSMNFRSTPVMIHGALHELTEAFDRLYWVPRNFTADGLDVPTRVEAPLP